MPANNAPQKSTTWLAASGLLSGLLLALCFPPVNWSFLAWGALVPLGFILTSSTMPRQAWAGVYLGGLIFHLWVFDWIRTLYGGIGLQGSYVSGWLITGQVFTLLFCLLIAVGRTCVLSARMPTTIVLPLIWISYEYLQHFLTAVVDQSGTRLLSLAYTQVDNRTIVQIADLGGASIVSFMVATVNGCCFDVFISTRNYSKLLLRRPRFIAVVTVPISIAAAYLYGLGQLQDFSPGRTGPTICLMGKEDLPPLLDRARIPCFKESTEGVLQSIYPDLLLWPELSYHHTFDNCDGWPANADDTNSICYLSKSDLQRYSRQVREFIERAAFDFDVGILMGCERLVSSGDEYVRYNCLAFADSTGKVVGYYDKRHLVPFTETTMAGGDWLQIPSRKNFERGQHMKSFALRTKDGDATYAFGCGLCFDVAFAEHFRQQLQNDRRVDLFLMSGSEGADATGCMSQMLLRMAQLRAIETRRPIVRNAYLGYSGLIDANGRVVQISGRRELGSPWLLSKVPLDSRVNFYSQWGDWLSPICSGVVVLLLVLPWIRKLWLDEFPHRTSALQRKLALNSRRYAFSLLELMAVVAVLGTITVLIIPRVVSSSVKAKYVADGLNRSKINSAVERWYLEQGYWPANDLSDLGADPNYFPEGIPTNPINNLPYSLSPTTHRVIDTSGGGGGGK